MTDKIRNIILLLTVMAMTAVMAGCQDDFLRDQQYDPDAPAQLTIDFIPLASSKLDSRAATSMTVPTDQMHMMQDIDDICLVVFDSDGGYVTHRDITKVFQDNVTDQKRTDADASNGIIAGESSTKRSTVKIADIFPEGSGVEDGGSYYIYAVANLGTYDKNTLKSGTMTYLTDSMCVSGMKREDFRNWHMLWDRGNFRNNRAMAGYFAPPAPSRSDGASLPPHTSTKKDPCEESAVRVASGTALHCWLRRLASKVTIDFDGSKLSPGTTVYIKEVRVYDVPFDCSLIAPNSASAEKNKAGGITEGYDNNNQWIRYCDDEYIDGDLPGNIDNPDANYENWPSISSIHPRLDASERGGVADPHANDAPSLFFYENMQGVAESKDDWKLPDHDNDGIIDSPTSTDPNDPDYKDRRKGGTFVEVIAFYKSMDEGNEGSGTIRYRFMLGKNTTDDYDAERNFHYKLTLYLRGFANDYDWHIEYNNSYPPVTIQNPCFISYGYNQSVNLPIKIAGKLTSNVTVEIIRNDWWPSVIWKDEEGNTDYHLDADKVETPNGAIPSVDNIPDSILALLDKQYKTIENKAAKYDPNKLCLGFLSLRESHSDAVGRDLTDNSYTVKDAIIRDYLVSLWNGQGTDPDVNYGKGNTLYKRVYTKPDDGKTGTIVTNDTTSGSYSMTVKRTPNGDKDIYSTLFNLPLFTRQRNIIKKTGFTGNNPYDTNQRRAQIRLTFKMTDNHGTPLSIDTIIDVIQASKVTNPMGVWRRWNNAKPFQVTLMHRDGVNDTGFRAITSKGGGWSAEVEVGGDWILLNGGKKKIFGDSIISFSYRPIGPLPNKNMVRCGIILVRYHNYSCVHRIMVRQGYAPIRVNPNGPKWHTFNLIANGVEADSPLDEGSMFKWGNLDYPIDASENKNDKPTWIEFNHLSFKDHSTDTFLIAGSSPKKYLYWKDIESKKMRTPFGQAISITSGGNGLSSKGRIFSILELAKMRDHENSRYRYGILYGDDATETQTTLASAQGFKGGDSSTHSYGMRGCFVYNEVNGNQIFLPIGTSGYGHRRGEPKTLYPTPPDELGWSNRPDVGTAVLRYASGRVTFMKYKEDGSEARYQPLFYDLFRRYGANYWANGYVENEVFNITQKPIDKQKLALDLNYFTFDFNPIGNEMFNNPDADNSSDAIFIRLVE